jgi:hypothetical protein
VSVDEPAGTGALDVLSVETTTERVHYSGSERVHTGGAGGLRRSEHHADSVDIDGGSNHVRGSAVEIDVLPGESQDFGDAPA